jgi:hypothetical protein
VTKCNQPTAAHGLHDNFTTVSEVFDDGGAMLRRLDGRGEVMLDARGALRVGQELRVGARIELCGSV